MTMFNLQHAILRIHFYIITIFISQMINQQQSRNVCTIHPEQSIILPPPQFNLVQLFVELKSLSKERLDTQENQEGESIKGLKFISAKLAKLFGKNRKLPYNQISKILIDNFASQQKDERNIKRRVYDAINVLLAAQVFQKKGNFIQMQKNKIKLRKDCQKKSDIIAHIDELKSIIQTKKQRLANVKRQLHNISGLITRNKNKMKKQQEIKIQNIHMLIFQKDMQQQLSSAPSVEIKWGNNSALLKRQSKNSIKSSKSMSRSLQHLNININIKNKNKSKVQIKSFLEVVDCIAQ